MKSISKVSTKSMVTVVHMLRPFPRSLSQSWVPTASRINYSVRWCTNRHPTRLLWLCSYPLNTPEVTQRCRWYRGRSTNFRTCEPSITVRFGCHALVSREAIRVLDTHRRNHDKLVAQTCANQLKVQTKKDVLSLSVRARSLPSFEGMDTENRLMGTYFLFLITDNSD